MCALRPAPSLSSTDRSVVAVSGRGGRGKLTRELLELSPLRLDHMRGGAKKTSIYRLPMVLQWRLCWAPTASS